jgi:eukaryotic-like serine/threonine-protein kinase
MTSRGTPSAPELASSRGGDASTAAASPSAVADGEPANHRTPSSDVATRTSTSAPESKPRAEEPSATPLRDPARYRILGEHGRGGLGRVARAHDVELGREIAIKELISRGPISEARFLREAVITARLEHPGIVPVYEAGRWLDGTPFYAMKLVAGRPLRDLLAERRTIDERIGLLHHVIAVADAIAYAHGRNIIHRDLKPSNVLVGDYGETVVIDWGLAKEVTASEDPLPAGSPGALDAGLTHTGAVLGTPAYMPPEQARGEPVDQRADVFAIGAMLWELCSVQRLPPAYAGQRRRILLRAGIDQDLAAIILKAIDPDREHRYPDAGALATDLKAFKAGARIAARRYSLWALLMHWARRHRTAAIAIAIATAVSVAGVSFYVQSVSAERERAERAHGAIQDAKAAAAEALADKRVADARAAEAALEQGRAALLHHEPEAQARLTEAYKREPSPSTAFMLARAIQPRLEEEAQFASTFGRMLWATFSPDGSQIVTTDDRAAQIWDGQTYRLLATLSNNAEVWHASYSPDGALLVTGGLEHLTIWDARRGVRLRELRARNENKSTRYLLTAFSPDGRFVTAIDSSGSIVPVWSATTGDLVAELHNSSHLDPSIAFSRHGWLATSGGGEAQVFDTRTWTRVLELPGQTTSLAFDSGSHLITGAATGEVAIWDVPSGARLRQLRGSGETIDFVAFSPNGRIAAAGSRGGWVGMWDAASGAAHGQMHPSRSWVSAIDFDPTGKLVLIAHADGTVLVADAAQGLPITMFEGPRKAGRFARFDATGGRVVTASWTGTASVWRAHSPYRRWSSEPTDEDCQVITTPEPQGRYVAVGCKQHPVRIWDTAHDRLLAELPSSTEIAERGYTSAFPAVSADGERAAIAHGSAVEVYELPAGRLVRTVAHRSPVSAIAFAAAGHDVISGALDGSVLIAHDDGAVQALPAGAGVDAVALLPDGRAVASDAQRRLRIHGPGGVIMANLEMPARVMSIRPHDARMVALASYLDVAAPPTVIDLETYRTVQLVGHVGKVYSARWVTGNRILTAGQEGTARMWDAVTGRQLTVYRGGTWFMGDASLLNDGIVVAGDADGLLRFWDAGTGARLWTLQAHASFVVGVHVQDGDIITRAFTGEMSRWRLPPAAQAIEECTRRPHCANTAE